MQPRFLAKCKRIADELLSDEPMTWPEKGEDDAYHDDGTLHVRRYGIHVAFGLREDTPGDLVNEQTRKIMAALGMKRKISERVLVEEECETCDGEGYVTCEHHEEHDCNDCNGTGLSECPTS